MPGRIGWKCKALLQHAFSLVPRGDQLNYFCQRWVTKSLPTGDEAFCQLVSKAKTHIDVIRQRWARPISKALLYEFGAGCDMLGPLTFWALGAERQILIDIRKLVRPELVNSVIDRFQRLSFNFPLLRKPLRQIETSKRAISSLKEHYGIDYRAPCDARSTGLEMSSVDCITSTSTLEHIPPRDIRAILGECHRILKEDGIMSFRIDYEDHYSYFDDRISVYNFLRYADKTWALFNPGLHYQNRLRHRDYVDLFRATEFELVEEKIQDGTAADLEALKAIPLARRFSRYSPEETAVRGSLVVLRKPI